MAKKGQKFNETIEPYLNEIKELLICIDEKKFEKNFKIMEESYKIVWEEKETI